MSESLKLHLHKEASTIMFVCYLDFIIMFYTLVTFTTGSGISLQALKKPCLSLAFTSLASLQTATGNWNARSKPTQIHGEHTNSGHKGLGPSHLAITYHLHRPYAV